MSQQPVNCPVCNQASLYNFSSRDLMFNHFNRFDYHQCQSCDLIFQFPLPSPQEISAFYPNEYDIYEETSRLKKISPFKKALLKNIFGYTHLNTTLVHALFAKCFSLFNHKHFEIPFIENGTLLDIGCGNGRFLHGMQQLGWKIKGVEFNAHAVSVCRKSGLDVHHGDLLSTQFQDNSFDVINLSHVIEHVPDPKAIFVEVARILKPDGLFIVKTPNSEALGRALFNTNWFANEVPRHLYLFSQKNLSQMGDAQGLKPIKMMTSSTPKIILNSVDYVLNNRKKASKRIRWKRMLAKAYVLLAKYKKQGDEIHIVFKKQ